MDFTREDMEWIYENDNELKYLYSERPLNSNNWRGPIHTGENAKYWAAGDFLSTIDVIKKRYMPSYDVDQLTLDNVSAILKVIVAAQFAFVDYCDKVFRKDLNINGRLWEQKWVSTAVTAATKPGMESRFESELVQVPNGYKYTLHINIEPALSFLYLEDYLIKDAAAATKEHLDNFKVKTTIKISDNLDQEDLNFSQQTNLKDVVPYIKKVLSTAVK